MDLKEIALLKEIEISQPTPQKRGRKPKIAAKQSTSKSDPPRTRSKDAQHWTKQEALVLVDVISVIEADCLKNVSSFQKWKIIAEHCTELDLRRTVNQCRMKWKSLVTEYYQIKHWDSRSENGSFWNLNYEKRKELQLPENFDEALFQAIGDYVRAQVKDVDTDSDTDVETEAEAEAQADLLGPIAESGSKRRKPCSSSEGTVLEERPRNICDLEQPCELQDEVGPQKSWEEVDPQMWIVKYNQEETRERHPQESCRKENLEITNVQDEPQKSPEKTVHPQESCRKENIEIINVEDEPQKSPEKIVHPQESCRKENLEIINAEDDPQKSPKKIVRAQKKKIMGQLGEEEMAAFQNLSQNAETILAVVQGNLPGTAEHGATNPKSVPDSETDFARQQGDSLITCLGNIVSILNKFPYLIHEP
ncbi:uncharacterized protein [Euphorbia lathyris]|uniref:uncharacterized protein n=1 Tax=Euphorbia lathyris TaxID=212925 RepID=UPI0033133C2A